MKGSYNAPLFFVIDNMFRTRVAQKNCAWTGHSLFLCPQQCVNVKRQIRRRADLIHKNIFKFSFLVFSSCEAITGAKPCLSNSAN